MNQSDVREQQEQTVFREILGAFKMRADFLAWLAGIRLNLTNVEQFLSVACSLADDNPPISRPIREAANEVRSSAMLIVHLRSLFSHQQAIEQQQQLRHFNQHFSFLQCQQSAAFSGASNKPNEDQNLTYFSYTNKQTLIKASKSLVANVAKILYLSDEIVLECDRRQRDQSASALVLPLGPEMRRQPTDPNYQPPLVQHHHLNQRAQEAHEYLVNKVSGLIVRCKSRFRIPASPRHLHLISSNSLLSSPFVQVLFATKASNNN